MSLKHSGSSVVAAVDSWLVVEPVAVEVVVASVVEVDVLVEVDVPVVGSPVRVGEDVVLVVEVAGSGPVPGAVDGSVVAVVVVPPGAVVVPVVGEVPSGAKQAARRATGRSLARGRMQRTRRA